MVLASSEPVKLIVTFVFSNPGTLPLVKRPNQVNLELAENIYETFLTPLCCGLAWPLITCFTYLYNFPPPATAAMCCSGSFKDSSHNQNPFNQQ